MSAVARGAALIIRMSTARGAAFAGAAHLRRQRRFHDDRGERASVELCRRRVERLGLWDPHLRRCRSRPGEVLAGAGSAIHYPALTAAIPAAPMRGSFAQNNRSADCDADRRHGGRRSEQMPQGPTFVPKGADLYQTAAMRSGSVKSTLLSGPVFDGVLEGSAAARGKCPTPCFAFSLRHPRPARPGPVLSEPSERPNGGQPIQGVEAMADVTSSDRSCAATSDITQLPPAGVVLCPAREAIP
jgi:hypothetical protein